MEKIVLNFGKALQQFLLAGCVTVLSINFVAETIVLHGGKIIRFLLTLQIHRHLTLNIFLIIKLNTLYQEYTPVFY